MRTKTTAQPPKEKYQDADVVLLTQEFLDRLTPKLEDVYDQMGIAAPEVFRAKEFERAELTAFQTEGRVAEGALALFNTHYSYQAKGVAARIASGPVAAVTSVQEEIGAPGTYIVDGRIEVDHNSKLKPYQVRGRQSLPGTNEEIYRTEPVVFKSVNEVGALITNATYEPTECGNAEADAIAKRFHRSLKRIRSGYDNALANAATIAKHGFAPFEKRWQTHDDGFVDLHDLAFREQATVERWIYDDKQSFLEGAEFVRQGDGYDSYILPRGETPDAARLLVMNLHATGNNVEGVSPIRVITGLRRLKELVLSCAGIGFQKFGVPIPIIVQEAIDVGAALIEQLGEGEHKAELQKLVTRLINWRSRMGDPLRVPLGFKVEYAVPNADMPDSTAFLAYLDTLMALVFHNEGALLGSNSFGSYAMAAVADSKFMRAAPAYAGRIACAFTEMLHECLRWNHSDFDSIEQLPEYSFRFTGTQDAGEWVNSMTNVMNAQPWNWPAPARQAIAQKMGLPQDAYDAAPEEGGGEADGVELADGQTQGDDLQRTALNGAQVTSMVEVVQAVAAGLLPAESAIRILMRAFQMSREDAEAVVNPSQGFEQPTKQEPAVPQFDEEE